jgi:hypothetical protein
LGAYLEQYEEEERTSMILDEEKTNFLEETEALMAAYDVTPASIQFMGSDDGEFAINGWDEFKQVADFKYDSGYGSVKVPSDFIIIGSDWWMTRSEYDGAEGWEFHKKPTVPSRVDTKPIIYLKGDMWPSIKKLNAPDPLAAWDDYHAWTKIFQSVTNDMYIRSYSELELAQVEAQAERLEAIDDLPDELEALAAHIRAAKSHRQRVATIEAKLKAMRQI